MKKIIIILVLSLIVLGGCVTEDVIKEQDDFTKNYIIALNNYHSASSNFDMALINLRNVEDYVVSGEYYYISADNLYTYVKEYLIDSESLLLKTKKKFGEIQNKSSNSFFNEDIEKRIQQTELLLKLTQLYSEYTKLSSKELYEINYGSSLKAKEYFDKHTDMVDELNNNLQKLSDISNEIDLMWEQDWYITFQG